MNARAVARGLLLASPVTTSTKKSMFGLAVIAGITALAPLIGGRMSRPGLWYRSLRKPPQTPPPWVFGPVWGVLYVLSALSAWRVWKAPRTKARRAALTLWGVQHGLNAAWTPIFFGAHRPRAALGELGAIASTAIAYTVVASKVDKPAMWFILPYVGWLGFAGSINAGVVALNPGKHGSSPLARVAA